MPVVAHSFARIFYRNAINIGLPVVEIGAHEIVNGSEVEVDLVNGRVVDHAANKIYAATQMPAVMMGILGAGGLVNYLREYGGYRI